MRQTWVGATAFVVAGPILKSHLGLIVTARSRFELIMRNHLLKVSSFVAVNIDVMVLVNRYDYVDRYRQNREDKNRKQTVPTRSGHCCGKKLVSSLAGLQLVSFQCALKFVSALGRKSAPMVDRYELTKYNVA